MNPFIHKRSGSSGYLLTAVISVSALLGLMESEPAKEPEVQQASFTQKPRAYVPPAPIVVISRAKAKRVYKPQPKRIVKTSVKSQEKRFTYKATNSLTSNSLAHVIYLGESRQRGYQDYNRGSSRKCGRKNRTKLLLTDLRIRDIQKAQAKGKCQSGRLFATGVWQIIPSTLNQSVNALGISKNQRYSPAMQNHIFVNYLTKYKRPAIYNYIVGRGSIKKAGLDVALEWASMQSPLNKVFYRTKCRKGVCKKVISVHCRVGRGCYDGWGTNSAHTSYKSVERALRYARKTYLKLKKEGHQSNKAYALALGVNNL